MDNLQYLGLLISFLLILCKILQQNKVNHQKNHPPSPPSLPIIGHFHFLKGKSLIQALSRLSSEYERKFLIQSLSSLSKDYGPILFLRLGSRPALALSTSSAVEECYTKNDIVFANRPQIPSRKITEYNYTALALVPYGQHWRNLRRLATIQVFSASRIQKTSSVREEEIRFLVKELFSSSTAGMIKKVDMKSFFYMLTFNVMVRLVCENRYLREDSLDPTKDGGKLEDVRMIFTQSTRVSLGDYFPILRFLTSYGEKKRTLELFRKREEFIKGLMDANRNDHSKSSLSPNNNMERRPTIIDAMLSLQESEPEVYTDDIIKGIITAMLVAGTDTSAMTMYTAFTHLLSYPDIFKKTRDEIDANVPQNRLLDDADLPKLPYLHCVINETLRLGPVGSFIPPHESSEECTVGGYDIPRGTMLLINSHALHRDPKTWVDPDTFRPERFQGVEGEMKKGGYNFIPFGSGRRKCPGATLATRLMALSLGTLIQCFDWEIYNNIINDSTKMKVNMDLPVEVIVRPRKEFSLALSHP